MVEVFLEVAADMKDFVAGGHFTHLPPKKSAYRSWVRSILPEDFLRRDFQNWRVTRQFYRNVQKQNPN